MKAQSAIRARFLPLTMNRHSPGIPGGSEGRVTHAELRHRFSPAPNALKVSGQFGASQCPMSSPCPRGGSGRGPTQRLKIHFGHANKAGIGALRSTPVLDGRVTSPSASPLDKEEEKTESHFDAKTSRWAPAVLECPSGRGRRSPSP